MRWVDLMNRLLSGAMGLLACAALVLAQAPAADKPKDASKPAADASQEVAIIDTTDGEMVIEFWPDVAPKTVENFKSLARAGFYNGTSFHRIIKGFMIQGGDPFTKDPGKEALYGQGGPGHNVKAEFNDHKHVRGVISMARSANPDSAGSQFFICDAPAPSLDRKYTAFGKLIKGDDVLTKIASTPVVRSPSGEPSKPTRRVEVKSIRIVPANSIQ
jgi:peptidyl-prolyl cis-trans isomerase B (cyclophilin B)